MIFSYPKLISYNTGYACDFCCHCFVLHADAYTRNRSVYCAFVLRSKISNLAIIRIWSDLRYRMFGSGYG